jgi:hypothetical protein
VQTSIFSKRKREGGFFQKATDHNKSKTLNPNKRGKRRKNKARKPKPKSIEKTASLSAFL